MEDRTVIGRISAALGGDNRYIDTLTLTYDSTDRTVRCEVRSTAPAGGMDGTGEGEPTILKLTRSTSPDPRPGQVIELVKRVMARGDLNFDRHGKPTKRFEWYTRSGTQTGLSAALAGQALVCAEALFGSR